MNYTDLQLQFEQSATLRLLRSGNAPLVLAVLFAAFKREHHPVVPESRLRALLEAEIEELRDAGDFVSARSAKDYLTEWADAEHSYLHRFQPADSDEPAYELTPEVERVFQWLDSLKPRPHVGTESQFKNLAGTLAEIVENSTREPDVRIQRLRAEQARLQEQIEEIERTGVVPVYNATQINERFQNLLEIARQLLGDFREVERHFRMVTEEIAVRQTDTTATRGGIVSQTLDAQDRLRESSQGQSFYAFWDFLLAPERRRQFVELVEAAYALPNLADELRGDVLLRKLQSSLRAEGNKVVASNERLVAQLRRVLDVRESAERREVGRLIQEIKALAHRTRDLSPQTELLDMDASITLSSLMSKASWTPPESVEFGGSLEVSEGGDYRETLEAFLRLHPVDFERLRQNIRDCLQTRVQISLPELLDLRPPRNGILEVLAYLLIAESDGPHMVFDAFDSVEIPGQSERRYGCIYFACTAPARNMQRSEKPELAWLKDEFNLSDAEFKRVSELHSAYLPQCQEMCRKIDAQNVELQKFLAAATNVTPEIESALAEASRLRADCQTMMLRHFMQVSQTMPPEQGRRYLDWVKGKAFQPNYGMNGQP